MTRLSRWLLSGIVVLIPLSGLFAQVTDPKYDSGNTYREVTPGTDGCGNPMCHYHVMQTWGNDLPIKEYAYRGRDTAANVLEFMNWRMLFPVGFKWDGSAGKYPLIVMLHGSGESGRIGCCGTNWAPNNVKYDNNDHNVLHGGKEHQIACGYSHTTGLPSGTVKWPGIVLWPQSSYNGSWEGGWDGGVLANDGRMVTKIIEWVINNPKYNVDPDRISIHGLSNGAQGIWDVAAKRPDLFAAVLPMSGVATNYDAETDPLVTTPIWQFQGGKDTNPNPQASLDLYNMLVAKGGNPRYTLYPSLGHGTWTTAYQEPDFWNFMLTANKKKIYVFGGDPSICPGGTLKLGISAGFATYQWTIGGADIPGANARYYNATAPGTYRVRMTRQLTVLAGATVTSDPVTIVATTGSSFVPTITKTGSLQIPISDGSTPRGGVNNEVKLTAPLGYETYYWKKNGIETPSSLNTSIASAGTGAIGDAGTYSVKVLLPTGCISSASNSFTTIWTDPQPTSPLTNIPGETGISATSVQVTWNDLSTETGYEIWRYRFSSGPPFNYNFENVALVAVVPANTVSYVDQGLRPTASYRYFVRAIQSGGGATFSLEPTDVALTLADTSPPTTPVNLAASNYLSDGSGLTLTWDLATDDDHVYKYEVYNGTTLVGTVTSPSVPLPEGLTPPPTTFNVTGLAPNSTNIFSVRAADWTGNYSPFSDGLSVNTQKFVTGLDYRYYEHASGTFVFLQAFDFTQEPIRIGTTSSFTISGSGTVSSDKFIFSFEGYLDVQTAGSYSFTTISNDGSMLYIDNDKTGYKLIVNNDTQKANNINTTVISTPITFSAAGKYPIKVLYSEFTQSSSLTVQWKLPPGTGSFATIPAARLFRLEKTFYYLRTGVLGDDPSTTLAWTTNSNGGIGGAIPVTSFTDAQRYFILANRPTVNLTLPWSVTGTGSKVVVGNGSSTAVTLNLNASLTGTVEAGKNGVIDVNNAALPSFGSLDVTSTVNFNVSGSTNIPSGSYGFVNLGNSGTYTLPTGSTIMKGNLSVASGTTAQGTANNLSTVTVGGNVTFNNSNPNPGATNRYTLKLTGGVPHTVGLSTATDLNLFSLVADGGDAVQFTNLSGHTLSVGGSSGGGLVLRSGASLNLLGANLNVTGNGTINPTNETGFIAMNGGNFNLSTTAPQTSNVFFSTTPSQNLVTNFTASAPTTGRISVGSQANISNLVTLTGGELNSNSGALTLVSDAVGTARIGPLTNGARITGSIAAQRYMPMEAPGRIFRYISSPVKNLSVQALQNYMTINGDFTGSSTAGPPGTIASMFSFAEPNYVFFPPTGGSNLDTLRRGRGYVIYVYEPTSPTTWVATGTPYQGTISFSPLTPGTASPSDGWNLLGNPYASPIQWTGSTSGGWTMSGVGQTVYVRHNFGTQWKWKIYHPGITGGELTGDFQLLTNGIIASGQGFWVQTSVASPSLTISESAKYTPDGGTYYRTQGIAKTASQPDVLGIRMSNNTYDDIAYILHDDQGSENYEKLQDAVKQQNSYFSLSTRSKDGISLVINVTPHTFCQKEIKLNIENAATGNYTLSFFGMETFQRPVTTVLQDNFTGTTTELQAGSTYDFAVTADAASTGAGRFVLTEKPIVLTNAALKTNSVCESNPTVTLLTTQPGVQYQALFNGGVLSDVITSTGNDSLKLTLDRKALGYGTHTINLIAGFPGCDMSTLDQTINVTVDTLQTPSIAYQSGGFLVASPANADHYQWMLDGTLLQGKTDPKLMDNNGAGNYQVKVSSGACSKVSTPFDVTALEDASALVKVYPNPFRDQIVVTLPEKFQGGTATLINPIGQKVHSVSIAPQDSYNVTLNFAGVEAGAYVLSVGRYKFKVIKIN